MTSQNYKRAIIKTSTILIKIQSKMDKSKLLEGLKKIKEAFVTLQKFVDAKLADGVTIVRYEGEKLDIGVAVFVITEQGAVEAPDADHVLEDGTMFTTVGGIVTAVMPVEEEVEAAAKPMDAPEKKDKPKSMIESTIKESYYSKEVIDKMFENLLTVKENFATQKNNELLALENKIELQNETIKQMFSLLTKIGNEPSAAPTEPTKKAFNVSEFRKAYKEDLNKIHNEIN
jgi:hypothetical protein